MSKRRLRPLSRRRNILKTQASRSRRALPPFRPTFELLEARLVLAGATISDSGGFEGSNETLSLGGKGGGVIRYSFEHFQIPDNFIIRYDGKTLLETGFVSGARSGTVNVPKGNATSAQVIIATNDQATGWNYTVTADACPDTTPFLFQLESGDFTSQTDANGDVTCKGSGTIFIGRTDGVARMLKVVGSIEFNKTTAKINGTVYSLIGAGQVLSKPLFTGSFQLNIATGASSAFSETATPGEYQLGGMDVEFQSISINRHSFSLGARFKVLDDLGIPNFFFSGADGLIVSQNDVRIAPSMKASFPSAKNVNLFGFLPIKEFSGFSISYLAPQDTVKLQGKLVIDVLSKALQTEITADLTGDNYIQIQGGKVDVKGELTAKNGLKFPPGGWGLEELKLKIDTLNDDFSAKATLTLPVAGRVKGSVEIGFKIPPLELNKVEVAIDNLNVLLGGGIFLQKLLGGVENFAPSDSDPIEFTGGLGFTYGPQIGSLAAFRLDITGAYNADEFRGTGKLTAVEEDVFTAQVTVAKNWKNSYLSASGSLSALKGFVTASFTTKATQQGFTASGTGAITIPDDVRIIGGTQIATGNFLVEVINDNTRSNDYAAAWGAIHIQKLGVEYNFVAGLKYYFDGKKELIGAKNIPETASWEIEPGEPYVVLAADWVNPASNVTVRVKRPDGVWIDEADFAASNIAVIDELSDSRTRSVLLANPIAGHWDLEVVNPAGLGDVSYTAVKEDKAPTITVTAPAANVPGGNVAIAYNAFDSDSQAEVRLFYDTDNLGFDGVEITRGLLEADGAGSYAWNTQGVAAGNYYVYAMAMDANNAPVFSYSTGQVQIAESADLAVSQVTTPADVLTGANFTYTFNVNNLGAATAANATAVVTLPPEAMFVSSTLSPVSRQGNVVTFALGSIPASQSKSFDVVVTAPAASGSILGSIKVQADTFDPVAANDLDAFSTFVEAPAAALPDLEVALSQPATQPVRGERFSYELTVRNKGAGPATNVVLTESLPMSQADFVTSETSQGGAGFFAGVLTGDLGTIAPGASVTVRITLLPFAAGNLVSTTSVTSAEDDAQSQNNFLITANALELTALPEVDLSLVMSVNNDKPNVGDQVAITATLTNAGPGVASGVIVKALLPADLEFISATPAQGVYDQATGLWDVGNLRDHLTRALTIQARVLGRGSINISGEVIAAAETDTDSTPNNAAAAEDDLSKVTLRLGAVPTFLTKNTGSFIDADGDKYTVKLSGPGRVAFALDDADGNGRGGIDQIVLEGTDPRKSSLSINVNKAKGGDGAVRAFSIVGTGLKHIDASNVDLLQEIELTGLLGKLKLRDILDGADVTAAGAARDKTEITVRRITGDTQIALGSAISEFEADDVAGGSIRAAAMGSLEVEGNKKLGAAGNFNADLGDANQRVPLKSAKIAGGINDAAWHLLGDVSSIAVGRAASAWELDLTGALAAAKFASVDGDSSIAAKAIKSLTAKGNFDADLSLAGANNGKPTLGSVKIEGNVTDAVWEILGNNIVDSVSIKGVATNWKLDVQDGKVNSASVAPANKRSTTPVFVNSNILARKVGKIELASVQANNGGQAFGVTAGESIDSVKVSTPKFSFRNKTALPQSVGDFVVTLD